MWLLVRRFRIIELETDNVLHDRTATVPAEKPVEEYVMGRLAQMGDEGYASIFEFKMNAAKEKIKSLPPEQLNALLAQFEIPDAIKS